MNISKKFRILTWIVNVSIYGFMIWMYSLIFPNFFNIINMPINIQYDSFFLKVIVGFVNYFCVFIIPILATWIFNLICVLIFSKSFPSIVISNVYKSLMLKSLDDSKNQDKLVETQKMVLKEEDLGSISKPENITASKKSFKNPHLDNYNRIKQGDCFLFVQQSIVHLFFLIPFIGWSISIIYFILTIIFNYKLKLLPWINVTNLFKSKIKS